jgi:hypothetical protein
LMQKSATVVVGFGLVDVVDGSEMEVKVVTLLETTADDLNKAAVGSASSVLTVIAIVADEVLGRQGSAEATATDAVIRVKVTRIADDPDEQLDNQMAG